MLDFGNGAQAEKEEHLSRAATFRAAEFQVSRGFDPSLAAERLFKVSIAAKTQPALVDKPLSSRGQI